LKKKVIVIGLDGLEPSIVERMLDRNELPNLNKLRTSGSYSRLATTYPAQTPVAWSSFVTGTNPGGHGIFDFIRRDPATYQPDIALSHFERPKSMLSQPRVVNRRQGIPVWQRLTDAGIPSIVLRCPCTFPPETLNGRMLAGVGVPDLRGSQSKGTFYTQDRGVRAQENEQVVHLGSGTDLKTRIIGPRNTRQSPATDTGCDIRVEADRDRLVIHTGGSPARIEILRGAWSEWVRFKFKLSMLQSVNGIARFYARKITPQVEFYVSAVNFDPAAPMFPVSSPGEYARELDEKLGPFSTLGMAEEHNGLNNGRIDEAAYLRQCDLVLEERERLMRFELARFQEGLFFMVFDTPDRVQHMLWRFLDAGHPGFDHDLSAELAARLEGHYRRCDALLTPVIDAADGDTLVIVLSDHGFNTFRRSFDTNTWLWQNGLLAFNGNGKPPAEAVESFASVDWSRTYAYAVGLGGIYLNFKDRERDGILVEGAETERVRRAIREGLPSVKDEAAARNPVRSVSSKEEIYRGAFTSAAPDLLVNFSPGYRVSWQSAMGQFQDGLIEDNLRRWSGDHIIDPEAVPGILFANRPLRGELANILDMAPTILSWLGVKAGVGLEGRPLI
jgi:predicted AlkP superfamily phosphohydrolase/phosphomutase